ncbi:MAG: hypothetical protein ACLQVA_12020 [Candidatus Brocadiia bacterium]
MLATRSRSRPIKAHPGAVEGPDSTFPRQPRPSLRFSQYRTRRNGFAHPARGGANPVTPAGTSTAWHRKQVVSPGMFSNSQRRQRIVFLNADG